MICDKCKKKIQNKEEFYIIKIEVMKFGWIEEKPIDTFILCAKCYEGFSVMKNEKTKNKL